MNASSILDDIKQMLGLDASYYPFDTDIIADINSVLMVLTQLGVGPSDGFLITGSDETWADFLGTETKLEAVRTYIYLKVKIVFDPPSSSTVLQAYEKIIAEFEWRLNVKADN